MIEFPAEPKIEAFLTDLAVHGNVAATTQHQAMNALVFLYKHVLNHAMQGRINAVRADKKLNVPVVMTREEVAAVISLTDGTAQLVAKLLTLRHSFGTHLLQRDTDIHTIQQLLGRNDLATIMIYTHILRHGGQGVSSPLDERGV